MEEPKFVHGRLAEAVHNAGYSFERACRELEWLLEDERWKECGQGFERIDEFLATVDFSEFKLAIEQRKKLSKKLTDLRATQRAVAGTLGVKHTTIQRDIDIGTNVPNKEEIPLELSESGTNVPTPAFQHTAKEAAELLDKKTSQIEKDMHKKIDEDQREKELKEKAIIDIENIHFMKFQDNNIEDNSIDHIFTDPPYPAEYLSEWEYLAKEAKRILKPSGFCICYSGVYNLPAVFKILSEHLEYYWQLILLHTGGNQFIHPRDLNTGYKPILVFQKPPVKKTDTAFLDLIKGTGKEKGDHKWRQAEDEAISILNKLTKTGDTILDPFAGTGTIHIACLKNKRIPISIECEEKNIKVIQERLGEIENVKSNN